MAHRFLLFFALSVNFIIHAQIVYPHSDKTNNNSYVQKPQEGSSYTEGTIIYPNPAQDKLYIQGPKALSFEIFNSIGERMITGNSIPDFIDLSTLQKGIYFVKIKTTHGDILQRFIKE
jgi:hypothetical protein